MVSIFAIVYTQCVSGCNLKWSARGRKDDLVCKQAEKKSEGGSVTPVLLLSSGFHRRKCPELLLLFQTSLSVASAKSCCQRPTGGPVSGSWHSHSSKPG